MAQNKNLVLVMGPPNTGKSTSIRNLHNQNKFVYMNTDLKELPFKNNFLKNIEVSDSLKVLDYIKQIEDFEGAEGGILDTLTFLMGMYERQYVINSKNTQAAWGEYGNFYRSFIHAIKAGTKDYVIFAHEDRALDEGSMEMVSRVPVKGAVGKIGVEADFTTILATKKVAIKKLEEHENDLLHITDYEREDGFKYVFQTRPTKDSMGEKMRSAMELWDRKELYIDNDIDQVFKRLKEYYA